MTTRIVLIVISVFLLTSLHLHADNTLVTRVPNTTQQKPGYIKNLVIVAEPHGAYTEQSLYLEYTDNGVFPGINSVEIIHRFELPEGAVVNDLWLWVGSDVMKGIILDTWTARGIYDSIVAMKRDPAFLTKRGNQYELKIYPLISGHTRKIKMNIIIPTRWDSANAFAELPLKYLTASGGATLPADLLFRQRLPQWGTPGIPEIPEAVFNPLADTMGYIYQRYTVQNVKALSSFRIKYGTSFSNGAFFDNNNLPDKGNFFQFGFIPWQVMGVDSFPRLPVKTAIGIDLSGDFSKHSYLIIPRLKASIKSSLAANDQFRLFVSGAGKIKELTENWVTYMPDEVDSLLNRFVNSDFGDSVFVSSRSRVLYGDPKAKSIWSYPGIDSVADIMYFSYLPDALNHLTWADAVAAYNHGFEDVLTDNEAQQIRVRLDSVFLAGGRFLTYYDRNRLWHEKLAKYYIPTLGVAYNTNNAVTLFRTEDGNISWGFPPVHDRNGGYFLSFNDSTVKKELVNSTGDAMVISKRMGNGGLLVVTGIWPFNDDASLRKMMAIPMLGLNSSAIEVNYLLKDLLYTLRNTALGDTTTRLLVYSNSDSLVNGSGTEEWINEFLTPLTTERLSVKSVNLLDGVEVIPPAYYADDKEFYGSGYLMHRLAARTYGAHFESHITDWTTINNLLSPGTKPMVDSLSLHFTFDGPNDSLISIKPVNNFLYNPDQPVIYMGQMEVSSQITANITARFTGSSQVFQKSMAYTPYFDTTLKVNIIPTMIGNEELKYMFANTPTDTAGIVSKAVENNLVSNYTALLCLEPNDTIHPIINPFDESGLVPVELTSFSAVADSGGVQLFWHVASEVNNARFTLVRIAGDQEEIIGMVSGRGTALTPFMYSFFDGDLPSSGTRSVRYILRQSDYDGTERIIGETEVMLNDIPAEYSLEQNYPNPFNPETTIKFGIPEETVVSVKVYNLLGELVVTLHKGILKPGHHTLVWNGRNSAGQSVGGGIYLYSLETGSYRNVRKMIILK
ncbi:MAG: T9SS type A sorting domain-containing protein [Ignavibacteriaceae bacterium]|nr:T9SS type A sorting domain-containing protein [Ignavibacteriaceae bacterium]